MGLPALRGIYTITSPSGKVYVGMTREGFAQRWSGHRTKLRRKAHHCRALQRAADKYGVDNLSFQIVEIIDSEDTSYYLEREQHWWDVFSKAEKELYNGRPTGTGSVEHTNETIEKIKHASASVEKKAAFEILTRQNDLLLEYASSPRISMGRAAELLGVKPRHLKDFCRANSIKFKTNSNAPLKQEITKDLVIDLYVKQELSTSQMARILECSQPRIVQLLKQYKIPARGNGWRSKI